MMSFRPATHARMPPMRNYSPEPMKNVGYWLRKTRILVNWFFLHRQPHPCIVRLVELRVAEKVAVMRELIESQEEAMRKDAIIVATRKQVRIRPRLDP